MEPNEEELNAQLNAVESEEEEVQEVEEQEQEQQPVEAQKQETEDEDDKPLTRGQKRIQTLANEKETARQEAALAKQQADFYRAQLEAAQRAQQQPQEDLDPMQKWQRDTNLALQQHQRMTLDMADKADFKLAIADQPVFRQYADQVETRLQQFRMQGGNPTREQVLTVILGEQMKANLAKAPKVKAEAAQRVRQATGKPLSTPTSVAAGKRDTSLYDRLKDQPI